MKNFLLLITVLIFEVADNIDELYGDEDFYTQVILWCIPLILIFMFFGSVIYLKLKKRTWPANPLVGKTLFIVQINYQHKHYVSQN